MSTKVTLKYQHDDETGIGFHLYEDAFDTFGDENGPVHLELSGVQFESSASHLPRGGRIDVTIPRAWAESLGLVAATDA